MSSNYFRNGTIFYVKPCIKTTISFNQTRDMKFLDLTHCTGFQRANTVPITLAFSEERERLLPVFMWLTPILTHRKPEFLLHFFWASCSVPPRVRAWAPEQFHGHSWWQDFSPSPCPESCWRYWHPVCHRFPLPHTQTVCTNNQKYILFQPNILTWKNREDKE